MKRITWLGLIACIVAPSFARAATTFTYLFDGGYPLSMSADGSVIVGNNASDYGPFRWTQATGRVALLPESGPTNGTTGVSADGKRVASTIPSSDNTFRTAGRWTLGQGWQQLMPPSPPDAGILDNELASVWGLSGDGNTVVGLYWRYPNGRAHALRWTPTTGAVDLGSTGRASRANGVNYDGSVIAGWDEHSTGFRRATAWVNGHLSILGLDRPGEAQAVNTFGNIVVGFQNEPTSNIRQLAMWKRNNSGVWSATQFLGYLPGTEEVSGINRGNGVSADGNMVVGYCTFAGDPFYTTGFVWTPQTGIVDINQFLADHGILPDPNFSIADMDCVSPDGRLLVGWGRDVVAPYTLRAFMIRIDGAPTDVATNGADFRVRLTADPNPVHAATTLQFSLPGAETGALAIYDSRGRLVRRLVEGAMAAGPHRVTWDGRDATGARVAAGMYYSRLETGAVHAAGKLVVLQ